MSRKVRIVGKVSKVVISRKSFDIISQKSSFEYYCTHDFDYLPLMVGDAVIVKGDYVDSVLTLDQYPMVVPGENKEAVVGYMRKGFRYKVGVSKIENIVSEVSSKYGSCIDYISNESQSYKIETTKTIFSYEKTSYSYVNSVRVSDILSSGNEGHDKNMIKWWYNNITLRRLYLLGLNKRTINEVEDYSLNQMYKILLDNPLRIVELDVPLCIKILKRTENSVTKKQIHQGKIARLIHKYRKDGWSGVPMSKVKLSCSDIDEHTKALVTDYKIVIDESSDTEIIYFCHQLKLENKVASEFNKRIKEKTLNIDVKYRMDTLDVDQKKAIRMAINNQISIITGPAGSGKTIVIGEIINNLRRLDISYEVVSFTGKAVARLQEVTDGKEALTMHRLMARGGPFKHLIIDEASMVSTKLMGTFLSGCGGNYKITLVGDVNQLLPIGWGSMFSESIKSMCIETTRLVNNYRSDDDGININSTNIIKDKGIDIKSYENFKLINGDMSDIDKVLKQMEDVEDFDKNNVTVLTPYNKNLENINKKLRTKFTNNTSDMFEEGDRVMMTQNNYEINVMNGEEGTVTGKYADYITVKFGGTTHKFVLESRKESYKDLVTTGSLVMSYGMTIHKSQGSEWKYVICYIGESYANSSFLSKNLLYTCITRAMKAIWVIGSIGDFRLGCSRDPSYRHDILHQRLSS
ncbi:MAG: AAA family ATPase [Flavobacteriaceae bacterium]|nr:AAA family ATPase [Flavobacteriaceae bacterium]PCJ29014.1 MAG: hypothetical protein COA94_02940 [Rickettsiales bacterium]